MDSVINCVTTKYATFSGRAPRSEYWLFVLVFFVLGLVATAVDIGIGTFDPVSGFGLVSAVLTLALFIPSLAVGIRRLHDTDRSGWWYLIVLIPLIGALALLVFFILKGTDGDNRFGPDPLSNG